MNFVLFLGILLFLGLASTRVMKIFKLPNVTGYLIAGLICAAICLLFDKINGNTNLNDSLIGLNEFISGIALGFIALSIGEEFRLSKLKEYGTKIVIITFFQALLAAILVDIALVVTCILLGFNLSIALCLGAIATATAPAATIMVIHQYKAKGPLVDLLLPVVAFDDAIGLIVFSLSVSFANIFATGSEITLTGLLFVPLIEIVGSILLGSLIGFLMHLVIKLFKSRNNHIVILITFTLLGVGLSELLSTICLNGYKIEFSNLLCCMMIGAVYVNIASKKEMPIVERDEDLLDRWTPFLFMLFFVLSGTHLLTSAYEIFVTTDLKMFLPIGLILLVYLVFRSLGKYFGAYIGCKITKRDDKITKYLGITLLPQAGVAIGMANQISGMESFKGGNIGNIIVTVVLCATLVYEIIGPLLTKWSLNKAGEIEKENL